ncbi:unnamed protein product [Brassicogethes aeneus]|uniref:Uncharacterized protein n=1 Tax=Brassicogethes aeneus TaxID=1431903 RepID=A0A9P0AZS4_BRAAE|nr:unnamed protein product [Brassicogethes aeneus]
MKIPEDIDFLLSQSQKGRPGYLAGIDKKLSDVDTTTDDDVDICEEHILGVPLLESGKAASAVYQLLEEHQLSESVKALCCDTTASNSGRINGACVLHIYELILKCAF